MERVKYLNGKIDNKNSSDIDIITTGCQLITAISYCLIQIKKVVGLAHQVIAKFSNENSLLKLSYVGILMRLISIC